MQSKKLDHTNCYKHTHSIQSNKLNNTQRCIQRQQIDRLLLNTQMP